MVSKFVVESLGSTILLEELGSKLNWFGRFGFGAEFLSEAVEAAEVVVGNINGLPRLDL